MRMELLRADSRFPLPPTSRVAAAWEFELEPGESVAPHVHETAEEIYCILSGTGRMTVSKTTGAVVAGDVVHIPAGSSHSIANTSSGALRAVAVEVRST